MKKISNRILIVFLLTALFSISSCNIPAPTIQGAIGSRTEGEYLGYASIYGDGNNSILEAEAENDLRIRIDSESDLLDFFINFDMTCNGFTDEGIVILTLSLDGENISANVTQTPTSRSGTLFLHDVTVHRGDTFLFVINVIYGNLIPLYHNETQATGAAVISKTVHCSSDNTPPNPPTIDGPASGKVNKVYTYEFTVSDPDENEGLVKLEINFGSEMITKESGCCGAVWDNGQEVNISYKWVDSGNYEITARVMDAQFAWSNWSDPFSVRISKLKLNSLFDTIHNRETWDWRQVVDFEWTTR